MIYTFTLNTAIDDVIIVKTQKKHAHNEIFKRKVSLGGKAIKTNLLLTKLGFENVAIGFRGGNESEQYCSLLKENNIKFLEIPSKSFRTRKTTVIVDADNTGSTMFVEASTSLSSNDVQKVWDQATKIPNNSIVVISGSNPKGFSPSNFKHLINLLQEKKCKLICDVSGQCLKIAIECGVYFVKPNEEEFNHLFNCEINEETLHEHLGHLNAYAVTLGSRGCMYKYNNKISQIKISSKFEQENIIKSTTGCGDMFIAGFVYGLLTDQNPFIQGTVYSMAKALEYGSDEVDLNKIKNIEKYIGG